MGTTLTTDEKVCNAALGLQGKNLITTLATDTTPEAVAIRQFYEVRVRAALTKHGWSFATTLEALTHSAALTNSDWSDSWSLPSPTNPLLNIQTVIDVGTANPSLAWIDEDYGIDYEIRDGVINTNHDSTNTLAAVVQSRATTSTWSDDFANSIVDELRGCIVSSLDKDSELGAKMIINAMRERESVYVRDRNQWKRQSKFAGPLIGARRGARQPPWSRWGS